MAILGVTDDRIYRIYNYTENVKPEKFNLPPYDLNYDILGFHKKKYFNKGELYKVEYFGEYDFLTNTYNKKILCEKRTFYRINEMVYKRVLDICWFLDNGISGTSELTGTTKQTLKFYTQEESLFVGERRRRNCITNLKIDSIGLIMMASGITQKEAEHIGWAFLNEFSNEINVFIEGVETPLMTALMTTQNHGWLDYVIPNTGGLTVRQYLYDGIDINYTENNTNMQL